MLTAVPEYAGTNESLDAIVLGLGVGPGDTVLAVAGSGDQAFAMLATGARVVVADSRQQQIDYVLHRAACLQQGNISGFLRESYGSLSGRFAREYFEVPGRLDSVRNNLPNLEVLPAMEFLNISCHYI